MNKEFKEYFYFTKTERNGIRVLLFLLLVFLLIKFSIPFFKKKTQVDFKDFKTALEKIETEENFKEVSKSVDASPSVSPSLFFFNPNTADKTELLKLGLSPKQANTLLNYRQKGAKFYKKEDLKKVYGISHADYLRLKDYINIPLVGKAQQVTNLSSTAIIDEAKFETFPFNPNTIGKEDLKRLGLKDKTIDILLNYRSKGATFRKKEDFAKIYGLSKQEYQRLSPFIQLPKDSVQNENSTIKTTKKAQAAQKKKYDIKAIDINKASIADWESLRGIGPTFAKRIVKFRDKLGGFHQVQQIKETYGLPDSTFQSIKAHLLLSTAHQKININTATVEELKAHPYISWKQANLIIRYRENHGNFNKIEDILKIGAFNQDFFDKIKFYLEIVPN